MRPRCGRMAGGSVIYQRLVAGPAECLVQWAGGGTFRYVRAPALTRLMSPPLRSSCHIFVRPRGKSILIGARLIADVAACYRHGAPSHGFFTTTAQSEQAALGV